MAYVSFQEELGSSDAGEYTVSLGSLKPINLKVGGSATPRANVSLFLPNDGVRTFYVSTLLPPV
jgi:hypothetical protein